MRENSTVARSVLLIAFHYPPCGVSSGLQRTLAFSRYLGQHGWHPVVLTVRPEVFDRTSPHQVRDIPPDIAVARTRAFDAAKTFAIRGRYWSRLALPDRWSSWWLTAVPAGLRLIRRHDISAIWSTYPIATAHSIAATLAKRTGLPWIADFRDPMVEFNSTTNSWAPRDSAVRSARLGIERRAVRQASSLVFCTAAAREIVVNRYPDTPPRSTAVIPNGYEERSFADAERSWRPTPRPRRLLLHSGTVIPGPDRDPTALFQALRQLLEAGRVSPSNFELRLRDPSNEAHFRRLADAAGIGELVTIAPPLSYREALAEMLDANGLLILQGYTSNPAVPAKLYEYLRARRPILPLVDAAGETARTLRSIGHLHSAPLTDVCAISRLLDEWLSSPSTFMTPASYEQNVVDFSRERLTARLATELDRVHAQHFT